MRNDSQSSVAIVYNGYLIANKGLVVGRDQQMENFTISQTV